MAAHRKPRLRLIAPLRWLAIGTWLLVVIALAAFAFSRPRFDGAAILLLLLISAATFVLYRKELS